MEAKYLQQRTKIKIHWKYRKNFHEVWRFPNFYCFNFASGSNLACSLDAKCVYNHLMWYIFYFGGNSQTSKNGFFLKAYPSLGHKICGVIMNHRCYRIISALMYKFHSLLFKDWHYLAHFIPKFLSNSHWKHQEISLLNKSFRYVMLCYVMSSPNIVTLKSMGK